MKKQVTVMIAIMFILTFTAALYAATQPPQVGGTLPDMKLQKLDDSKAQVLIIQIFSMYCPYCQKDAPNVNRFFGLIENNPQLKGKIKLIGIGAGNSQFEVNTFKKKYKVAFPLIPDGDFKIHKIVGEVRTPYFMVMKLNSSKKLEVVYSRLGAHENVEAFLAEVVKLGDVK